MSRTPLFAILTMSALLLSAPAGAEILLVENALGDPPTALATPGSLGWAVYQANNNAEPDEILFAVPTSGPVMIVALGEYVLTEPGTTIDGFSQVGSQPNTIPAPGSLNTVLMVSIVGSAIPPDCEGPPPGDFCRGTVFRIETSNTTIRGLNVHAGPLYEIGICLGSMTCSDNRIQGCVLGTDPMGMISLPSGSWGPYNPPQIIGVYITSRATANVVGSDADGLNEEAERNLISGEYRDIPGGDYLTGIGVLIAGGAGMPTANEVRGNLIGTDLSGGIPVPNGHGVALAESASTNIIADNVIAGNLMDGLWSQSFGGPNHGNTIDHNYIGLNPAIPGLSVGNGANGLYLGPGTVATQVGTGDIGRANTISGNAEHGVLIEGSDFADSSANVLLGNIIGLERSAAGPQPNGSNGVMIRNSSGGNQVGELGLGNIISGNGADGIELLRAEGVLVSGNNIGLNQVGDTAVPNGGYGVQVEHGGVSNLIADNQISHNGLDGIFLLGSSAQVISNSLTQNNGWGLLTNVYPGVDLSYTPGDDVISAPAVVGNTVGGNQSGGIYFYDSAPSNFATIQSDNTLEDNNGQVRLLQHWRAAVELLDSSGVPIGSGSYAIALAGDSGQMLSSNFVDPAATPPLWGPDGFSAADYFSWFDVEEYRIDAAGVLHAANPYTISANGPTAGLTSWTIDGLDNDPASVAGWPNGEMTGGQYRYQVVELTTESDSDGDGVGDSVDCAPDDPDFDGVFGAVCDADGDGYCDAAISGDVAQTACPSECANPTCQPSDCDDANSEVNPAGTEGPANQANCSDGDDNDCDGDTDEIDSDCQCASDVECDNLNLCDGVETCAGGVCQAGTAVDCSSLDGECTQGMCNSSDGSCTSQPANEGGLCDDSDPCTMDSQCLSGVCGGGAPADEDGDGFVSDTCGGDDCADDDPATNPAAAEICDDDLDNDCDGSADLLDSDCSVCGDGVLSPGEACDDGALVDGDGCSMACALEAGWACRQVASGESWCGTAASAGDVLITEITQNPDCVDDAQGEWLELRNTTAQEVQLRGFRLSDLGSDELFLEDLLIPAGEYALLCRNGDQATNGGLVCDAEVSLTLGNGDDELILSNPADLLVDQVAWDGGPDFPDPTGAAMSLTPGVDHTGNDDGTNWCIAITPLPGSCTDLGTPGEANPVCPGACNDDDLDGYSAESCGGTDCNDSDPTIHPDAEEICGDSIDQDCTGADLECGCADGDSDGYQDLACGGTDCDDNENTVNPGAAEICDDNVDNDCDGQTDDSDSDCAVPGCGDGVLGDGETCDDGNLVPDDGCGLDCQIEADWTCRAGEPSMCGHSATEGAVVITEIMQNPACATDAQGEWIEIHNILGTELNLRGWLISDDESDSSVIEQLLVPAGGFAVLCRNLETVSNGNIACDAQFNGNLGNSADEVILSDPGDVLIDRVAYGTAEFPSPNGASMSLSPEADDQDNDLGLWWCEGADPIPSGCDPTDLGTPGSANPSCGIACWDDDSDGHDDHVCGGDDCDDSQSSIHPGAEEVCGDDVDQDCTGQDLACDCPDADQDGFPDEACGGTDCADDDESVNPDATEDCDDSIDNDCDDLVDDDDPWCQCSDLDDDGYRAEVCGGDDCQDDDAAINPGAAEICDDNVDNDCDGDLDLDDDECQVVCPDADDDGFADQACGGDDCDDSDDSINPDAMENCEDSQDNDCDGDVDGDDSDCHQPCPDADDDGFESDACGGVDCDDSDPTVYLGAIELCSDGVDNDCDGQVDSEDDDCPARKSSDCGCATPADGSALTLLLLGLLLFRRKRSS